MRQSELQTYIFATMQAARAVDADAALFVGRDGLPFIKTAKDGNELWEQRGKIGMFVFGYHAADTADRRFDGMLYEAGLRARDMIGAVRLYLRQG